MRRRLQLRKEMVALTGEVGGAWRVVNERGIDTSPSPAVVIAST